MYRPPLQHRARPPATSPSRTRFNIPLTIRTSEQQQAALPQAASQYQGQSSSPPQLPYPIYPLPIPPEKQAKARKLYRDYLFQELTSKKLEPLSATSYRNESFLSVPGPPTLHSMTSHTSSRYKRAASVSTSTYDAATDFSSMVSFDGYESPSSSKGKAKAEPKSIYSGQPVKQHTRSKLSSVKRAKAALMRHLGSCWVCRSRKVPCPLSHYDLDSLNQLTPQGHRSHSQSLSLASIPSSSRPTPVLGGHQNISSVSQNYALAGIEGNPQLLERLGPIATTLDIQSPGGNYGDTHLSAADAGSIDLLAPEVRAASPGPYDSYQNGAMFAIGVLKGLYFCQHLDDTCNEHFITEDELQDHFAVAHFPFTRIDPAHRFVCSSCRLENNLADGPCGNCGVSGSIERWIFGHFIRMPSYERHAPDGQDLLGYVLPSAPLYTASTFTFSSTDFDFDLGNNFDGNINSGGFDTGENMYGGPGMDGYSYNPSGSDAGGSQYQGSVYGGARQMALSIPDTVQTWTLNLQHAFHKQKVTLPLLLLLVFLVLGPIHPWTSPKAQAAFQRASSSFHSHLPFVGFLGIAASFAISLSVKYFSVKRRRRPQFLRKPRNKRHSPSQTSHFGYVNDLDYRWSDRSECSPSCATLLSHSNSYGRFTTRSYKRCPLHALSSSPSKRQQSAFSPYTYGHGLSKKRWR
jgi:hypothetical protein